MSALASAIVDILPAVESIAHSPFVASALDAAYAGVQASIGFLTGWLREAINELVGNVTGWNEIDPNFGVPYADMDKFIIQEVMTASRTQAWSGIDLTRFVLGTIFETAVMQSLGEVVGAMFKMAVNARSVTHVPWAFDVMWLGQIIEDIDPNALAFLCAITGTHPIHLASYIAQALPWLYDMYVRNLKDAIYRALDRAEEHEFWDIDTIASEARWWFAEALRTYHRSIQRMTYIVDHIIERGLSRLWELRISLTTVYSWYTMGLVTSNRFVKAIEKAWIEVTMTWRNIEFALQTVLEQLPYVEYMIEIENLVSTLQPLYDKLIELEIKRINAVTRYKGFEVLKNNIDNAMNIVTTLKYRYDIDKAVKPPFKFWEIDVVVPMSSVELSYIGVSSLG